MLAVFDLFLIREVKVSWSGGRLLLSVQPVCAKRQVLEYGAFKSL